MKIPTIMMVAGAAIVFAAPVANAHMTTYDRTVPLHKIAKHKVVKPAKTAKAKTATTTKTAPKPPLYVYVPPFTGTPSVSDGTNWCETSMVDCTDQQLCEHWGMNCSTGGDQPSPAQPAEPASTTTSPSEVPAVSQLADDSQSASQATTAAPSGQDSFDDC
jgi:hypothetical protein